MLSAVSIVVQLASDLIRWCGLLLRPRKSLEAEILFLRRQLAYVSGARCEAEAGGSGNPGDVDSPFTLVGYERRYGYLVHDRDSIFSAELDQSIQRLGLRVLKSPPRSPTANAICERVIGTARRECLDWLIPPSEAHLRQMLKSWVAHYNHGRAHMALGPGVRILPRIWWCRCRRRGIDLMTSLRFVKKQYSVGCITSIRWRVREPNLLIHVVPIGLLRTTGGDNPPPGPIDPGPRFEDLLPALMPLLFDTE